MKLFVIRENGVAIEPNELPIELASWRESDGEMSGQGCPTMEEAYSFAGKPNPAKPEWTCAAHPTVNIAGYVVGIEADADDLAESKGWVPFFVELQRQVGQGGAL